MSPIFDKESSRLLNLPLSSFLTPGLEAQELSVIARLCLGDRAEHAVPHRCGVGVSQHDCNVDLLSAFLIYGYFMEFGSDVSLVRLAASVSSLRNDSLDILMLNDVRSWSFRETASSLWRTFVARLVRSHTYEILVISVPAVRSMSWTSDSRPYSRGDLVQTGSPIEHAFFRFLCERSS